jgi:hypothetical protein
MAISLLGRPSVHGFKLWRVHRIQWHVPSAPLWLLLLGSWTLMLDSMSCVAGPECFMLGALGGCVFGVGVGASFWVLDFFLWLFGLC